MFGWLKRWLCRENPYIGRFRGWHTDRYRAYSPDGEYHLWIANGFTFFYDCDVYPGKRSMHLKLLSRRERKLIWEALKHDLAEDVRTITVKP